MITCGQTNHSSYHWRNLKNDLRSAIEKGNGITLVYHWLPSNFQRLDKLNVKYTIVD